MLPLTDKVWAKVKVKFEGVLEGDDGPAAKQTFQDTCPILGKYLIGHPRGLQTKMKNSDLGTYLSGIRSGAAVSDTWEIDLSLLLESDDR